MLHAIGSLSPSIMYASPRVTLLPLTDACVSMGSEDDAPEYHGYFVTNPSFWVMPTDPL